jgi:nucleoside-diphosphate-sugar epimerase
VSRFAGQRVLVIGGLGFIGTNLAMRLLDEGARVTILTPLRERHAEQAHVYERAGATIVEGDIRDYASVSTVVPAQAAIFNLSGHSGAVRSMEEPLADLDVNCRGNLVLLEAIRAVNPQAKLVIVGSRLQYGKPARNPVGEDDEGESLCLHAVHKRTAEEYLQLYHRLFGVRFAVARVTNPYGPGQPSGRTAYGIINRWIHLALADQPLTVYGDGAQLRDYVHVDDVVEALIALASSAASDGAVYNVGSGIGTRMIDAARLILEVVGGGSIERADWPPLAAKIETGDFIADVTKIARELAWRPRIGLRDGLERTAAHYRTRVAR